MLKVVDGGSMVELLDRGILLLLVCINTESTYTMCYVLRYRKPRSQTFVNHKCGWLGSDCAKCMQGVYMLVLLDCQPLWRM